MKKINERNYHLEKFINIFTRNSNGELEEISILKEDILKLLNE